MGNILKAIHPDDDAHYEKLGLKRGEIQLWEDGLRTEDKKGNYEWWYLDAHFPDGSILVIVFYTKPMVGADGPMKPYVTFELTLPDGAKYAENLEAGVEDSVFTKGKCDVKIGNCRFVGDLNHYDIQFRGEKIQADVSLDSTFPAWRPQTGTVLFGDNEEHYFAWLPAVPEGNVTASVMCEGKRMELTGTGYHDHNWGNISMPKLVHHWYWGRAKIGDYIVISVWFTAGKKYGYKEFPVFLLAKDGKLLGDNSNHTLRFVPNGEYIDSVTKKPVYGTVTYEYTTPEGEEYRVRYARKSNRVRMNFADQLPGPAKWVARLMGGVGSYLGIEGVATVERLEDGQVVESVTNDSAVWELMYFGKPGADKKQ